MKIVVVSHLDRLIIAATTDKAQWPASNSMNEAETGTEVVSLYLVNKKIDTFDGLE